MKQLSRNQFLCAVAALGGTSLVGCGSESDGSGGASGSSGAAGAGGTSSGGTSSGGASSGGASSGGASSGGTSGAAGAGGGTAQSCEQMIDAQITCRHGHELQIPIEHIQAGASQVYNIKGTSTHSHSVTVTAEHFQQLLAGQTVTIFVPSQFQPHDVILSCAGLDPHAKDDDQCN